MLGRAQKVMNRRFVQVVSFGDLVRASLLPLYSLDSFACDQTPGKLCFNVSLLRRGKASQRRRHVFFFILFFFVFVFNAGGWQLVIA